MLNNISFKLLFRITGQLRVVWAAQKEALFLSQTKARTAPGPEMLVPHFRHPFSLAERLHGTTVHLNDLSRSSQSTPLFPFLAVLSLILPDFYD
jgi:hypothetical protein